MPYAVWAGGNTMKPVSDILDSSITTTTGITAYAGGGQANATALTTTHNVIGTVATGADSVKLPAAVVGRVIFVANIGANSAQVFGQTDETINAVASATGVALAATKNAMFWCAEAGKWRMILTA